MRLVQNKFTKILAVSAVLSLAIILRSPQAQAAACVAPATDYGSVTSTINVTSAGTYRVWSRIQQPNSTSNSYSLEIDGSTCHNAVGGNSSLAVNTWNWVDYKAGNSATKVTVTLSAGAHSIKMIGDSDGLLLDRVILTSVNTDGTTCTPDNVSKGDNCVTIANVAPTVSVSASPSSGTAPLNTTLTATPADSNGSITRVEFFRGTTSLGSKTSAPWTWPITGLTAGLYTYSAKATDNDGSTTASSSITVTSNAASTLGAGDTGLTPGKVDLDDLLAVINHWSMSSQLRTNGELKNSDGLNKVNLDDLLEVLNNWD